jgi:hypothetical protein
VLAQQVGTSGVARGFKYPDYDKASNLLRSLVTGKEARQQPNNQVRVKELRAETYRYDGGRQAVDLVIEAPDCLFDMDKRVASSPGPLKAQRADGRFSITGEGFEFRQLEQRLIVSKNVRLVVHADLFASTSPKP